jgi:hypothetical protein
MRKIVKYQLNEDGTIPPYIFNGGYFPSGNYLIGVSIEDDTQIDEASDILIKSQLIAHVDTLILYNRNLEDPEASTEMSSSEKEAHVDIWLTFVEMSDLE